MKEKYLAEIKELKAKVKGLEKELKEKNKNVV